MTGGQPHFRKPPHPPFAAPKARNPRPQPSATRSQHVGSTSLHAAAPQGFDSVYIRTAIHVMYHLVVFFLAFQILCNLESFDIFLFFLLYLVTYIIFNILSCLPNNVTFNPKHFGLPFTMWISEAGSTEPSTFQPEFPSRTKGCPSQQSLTVQCVCIYIYIFLYC